MNKKTNRTHEKKTAANEAERLGKELKREIKITESPFEKALSLSSDRIIAYAIKDMIRRDELN